MNNFCSAGENAALWRAEPIGALTERAGFGGLAG
jgi:hypothetical protein